MKEKIKNWTKRFWAGFQYFRKRYFGLRLIILLLLLFYFAPFPDLTTGLVNIATDGIFIGGVRTILLARGYRQLEIKTLEKRIVEDYDQDKNGNLDEYEQQNFQQATGFSILIRGSSPRIKANGREIIELAKIAGYKSDSYKELSLECLRKVRLEERAL